MKKLIESIPIFTQHDVVCSGGFTEWVCKSDFDRVVKIFTKQIEIYKVDATKFAEDIGRDFVNEVINKR